MMKIEFDPEAGEAFARTLDGLTGLAGTVTTVGGEEFDCFLGRQQMDTGWYDAVEVRRWDFEQDKPVLNGTEVVRVDVFRVF